MAKISTGIHEAISRRLHLLYEGIIDQRVPDHLAAILTSADIDPVALTADSPAVIPASSPPVMPASSPPHSRRRQTTAAGAAMARPASTSVRQGAVFSKQITNNTRVWDSNAGPKDQL
jgi:hypothetical protein